MTEAGAIAWGIDLEHDAMSRKPIDMVIVVVKIISKKKKKAPGSRRRFPMK